MAIWCDICANCSACRFAGLARSAFFDATTPHVGARSCRLGNRSFALSRKNGESFLGTRPVFAFSSRVLARTYAHSAGFRFLPSPFLCFALIFSTLWVKMVVFSQVHRFTTEKAHCAGERKWSVGASSSPSHELRGTVARGEGKCEGEFQKSSPLTG